MCTTRPISSATRFAAVSSAPDPGGAPVSPPRLLGVSPDPLRRNTALVWLALQTWQELAVRHVDVLAQYTAAHPAADADECSEHEIGGCLLQLLEATPGLVLAATLQGKLLYLNSKGRVLLGIGPDALARLRLQDIFTTSSYRRVRDEAIPGCLKIGRWQG